MTWNNSNQADEWYGGLLWSAGGFHVVAYEAFAIFWRWSTHLRYNLLRWAFETDQPTIDYQPFGPEPPGDNYLSTLTSWSSRPHSFGYIIIIDNIIISGRFSNGLHNYPDLYFGIYMTLQKYWYISRYGLKG